MHDLERFGVLLRRDLLPLLQAEGFEPSGGVFRRTRDERIDIVSLQGLRRGRRCCVNLGVHYRFLPAVGRAGGAEADHARLRTYDCVFSERLHEEGEQGHWWDYGEDDATAEASVASLVDTFGRRAPQFFAKFEPFPEVFGGLTPAHLEAGDLVAMPAGHSRAHVALVLARIMGHLGRPDRAREFAEAGLRDLGEATRLREELESLKGAG